MLRCIVLCLAVAAWLLWTHCARSSNTVPVPPRSPNVPIPPPTHQRVHCGMYEQPQEAWAWQRYHVRPGDHTAVNHSTRLRPCSSVSRQGTAQQKRVQQLAELHYPVCTCSGASHPDQVHRTIYCAQRSYRGGAAGMSHTHWSQEDEGGGSTMKHAQVIHKSQVMTDNIYQGNDPGTMFIQRSRGMLPGPMHHRLLIHHTNVGRCE